MAKKQLKIDGRLSHAKDLTFMDIRLVLSLLLRYFIELDKRLGKNSVKKPDSADLIAKLQQDLAKPNLSEAVINGYIKRLNDLKNVKANQGNTKELAESVKKIIDHFQEIIKLLTKQEKGLIALKKKSTTVAGRKKRVKTDKAQPDVSERQKRLDHIVLAIGRLEQQVMAGITVEMICELLQQEKIEGFKNCSASVRACLVDQQHQKLKGAVNLIDRNFDNSHYYFLTEGGRMRFRILTGKPE
ncbi:MAG: hypothetical protein NTZ49_05845 [Candidatus Parcubacteria bacterium]|nr:hypothetical protein [Candidatus Parcubacteria bacterium]